MGPHEALALFDLSLATDRGLALTRTLLDAVRADPLGVSAPSASEDELTRFETRHRLRPLVAAQFPTPERRRAMVDLTRSQLHLVATARRVCRWLDDAGIQTRVLKGLATAEVDYAAPQLRQTGDVDLLVARHDYERAALIIRDNGCEPLARRGAPGAVLKGSAFRTSDGVEIDLHFRISRYASSPADEPLFGSGAVLPARLLALDREGRLVHAAVHSLDTAAPDRRLSSVADLVAIIDNHDVEWEHARHVADRLGLTGLAGAAFRAEAAITGRAPHPGLEWPPPSWLVSRAFLTTRRRLGSEHLVAIAALPSRSAQLTYVRGWLLPPDATVDVYGGRTRYVQRLAGKLVGRSSGLA
ncbi:MAG: nucleotidyltransferase family protein [Actinomycetota bacterium]